MSQPSESQPVEHASAEFSHPRENRLLNPAAFKAVFDKRQSAHNNAFGIYCVKNQLGHPRLGLVVAKKVSKKAVVRNGIKRQIRDDFRHHQHRLGGHDFVVVAKAPLSLLDKATIRAKLAPLWKQALKRAKK